MPVLSRRQEAFFMAVGIPLPTRTTLSPKLDTNALEEFKGKGKSTCSEVSNGISTAASLRTVK